MSADVEVVEREFGEMALNMGPQHPSTHGVLRLVLHLSGETVRKAIPSIGYLHRGVEKLSEHLAYEQLAPVYERDDYLAPSANSVAYCLAVETLGSIEVPRRARWLRAFVCEWQRVASHLVWLGTLGLDLGGALGGGTTLYMYCFREREKILDFLEALTGTRYHTNVNMIGGCRYDLDAAMAAKSDELAAGIEKALPELHALAGGNEIFGARTRGVGTISKDLALSVGVTGPVLRASGIAYDVRKAMPYDGYAELPFEMPVRREGDALARYEVRFEEIRVALALVRSIVEGLPSGPIFSRKPIKNPKATKLPAGEAYAAVESPRGELGVHLVSEGGAKPHRLKINSPSFANLQVVPHLLPGRLVADVVAILGSLDPVMGDVGPVSAYVAAGLLSVAVLAAAMTIVAYLTWIERKVAARFQNRVGPYHVGVPHGWLQPLADVLKLIVKEDITPRAADRLLFNLAPVLVVVPALVGFAFIPLAKGLAVVDHPYSFLFFTAFASLTLLGVFAAGWASNNKYALLSSLRLVALLASYEIPLLLSLLVAALLAGSFRLTDVVEAQRGLWFAFHPCGAVAFLVFLACALAEGNKSPFDLLEAESELISAYNVEYSGIKFAIFYAGEYAHTLAVCSLAATVFLGGYLGPSFLPGVLWLLVKVLAVFVVVLWIRWSLLRVRIDQALRLNWLLLLPVALGDLLVTASIVATR